MQCPETLYVGIQRWWQTKNLYDSYGFRNFCKGLAEQLAVYMEEYERAGYQTVAGVYMEELKKVIESRGLQMPPFYGLALDDESADMDKILDEFNVFIKRVCK